MRLIGYCVNPVKWDGRGFYRQDLHGTHLVVFSDRSPYPEDKGRTVYGIARTSAEAGFDGQGSPWTTDDLEQAFQHGNGIDTESLQKA
jgi:hypothetical protein